MHTFDDANVIYEAVTIVSYTSFGLSLTHDPTNSFPRSACSFAPGSDRDRITNTHFILGGRNGRSRLPALPARFPSYSQSRHSHACRPAQWRKNPAAPGDGSPLLLGKRSVCP